RFTTHILPQSQGGRPRPGRARRSHGNVREGPRRRKPHSRKAGFRPGLGGEGRGNPPPASAAAGCLCRPGGRPVHTVAPVGGGPSARPHAAGCQSGPRDSRRGGGVEVRRLFRAPSHPPRAAS
ncbi:hypothetical protein M885DRAFT_491799, partial [Pelagophyceae sp. CCMP2097]